MRKSVFSPSSWNTARWNIFAQQIHCNGDTTLTFGFGQVTFHKIVLELGSIAQLVKREMVTSASEDWCTPASKGPSHIVDRGTLGLGKCLMWDNLIIKENWITESIAHGDCMAVLDGSYMEMV